jgi:hypothetical protein
VPERVSGHACAVTEAAGVQGLSQGYAVRHSEATDTFESLMPALPSREPGSTGIRLAVDEQR